WIHILAQPSLIVVRALLRLDVVGIAVRELTRRPKCAERMEGDFSFDPAQGRFNQARRCRSRCACYVFLVPGLCVGVRLIEVCYANVLWDPMLSADRAFVVILYDESGAFLVDP